MVKILTTDSYFNLFPILVSELKKRPIGLDGRNIVFCEGKVSLMAERAVCSELKGSFNTEVYSFGNYLLRKKPIPNLLSKEGSAMAVKRILSEVGLKCFKQSRTYLAPTLFDLIIQLKSAKVTCEDISNAASKTNGVLKNKLLDVAEVYGAYEKFIADNGFEDQSSVLSYLPEVIRDSEEIRAADVFILGFDGFTAQMRATISAIIDVAKSVTAILVEGDNSFLFVNETASSVRDLCARKGVKVREQRVESNYSYQAKTLVERLFNPVLTSGKELKGKAKNIYSGVFDGQEQELLTIAETIKREVLSGRSRYRDNTVAVADLSTYRDGIERIFKTLDIPYFLDEKKRVENHPLITLIISYADAYRKNMERQALSCFYKNPLFCADKTLSDAFENYVATYNVNYSKIKEPFTFKCKKGVGLEELEEFREKICSVFAEFNVKTMLEKLQVEKTLKGLTERLAALGETEEAAVNEQIYEVATRLLGEMQMMLGDKQISVAEFKNVFLSGVSALDLAIIPQYNDAVFIGGFKETALVKAKNLFVAGLTSDVPTVKSDVAILSDGDIDALEQIKVLVEPKIRVVNHRMKENVGMAISAFSERLFVTTTTAGLDGKKLEKSEVFTTIEKLFETQEMGKYCGYVTERQGLESFAKALGDFADGRMDDFSVPTSFYEISDKSITDNLLKSAKKEVKSRLNGARRQIVGGVTSPTVLEDYYKCPYRAFISHGLRLKQRDEGQVNSLSVGNLMHEIFKLYVDKIERVFDENSSNELFKISADTVLSQDEYKKFLSEKDTAAAVSRVLTESRKYCYKTYRSLKDSSYKCLSEVSFGGGNEKNYPALKLSNGKVAIKGKIDRLDQSEKYFRIIDYKTGSVDATDKSLFAGVKLQLYLYAAAVKKKFDGEGGKFPSGLYYLPVSDKFKKGGEELCSLAEGKTLTESDALLSQDKNFAQNGRSEFMPVKMDKDKIKGGSSAEEMQAYMNYAVALAEQAEKSMNDGVILPTPYENVCEYCEYNSLCGYEGGRRKIGKVDGETFINATDGGDSNARR